STWRVEDQRRIAPERVTGRRNAAPAFQQHLDLLLDPAGVAPVIGVLTSDKFSGCRAQPVVPRLIGAAIAIKSDQLDPRIQRRGTVQDRQIGIRRGIIHQQDFKVPPTLIYQRPDCCYQPCSRLPRGDDDGDQRPVCDDNIGDTRKPVKWIAGAHLEQRGRLDPITAEKPAKRVYPLTFVRKRRRSVGVCEVCLHDQRVKAGTLDAGSEGICQLELSQIEREVLEYTCMFGAEWHPTFLPVYPLHSPEPVGLFGFSIALQHRYPRDPYHHLRVCVSSTQP